MEDLKQSESNSGGGQQQGERVLLCKKPLGCISPSPHPCREIQFLTHNAKQRAQRVIKNPILVGTIIQDLRLLYYLIREIQTWPDINHVTVHRNTYCAVRRNTYCTVHRNTYCTVHRNTYCAVRNNTYCSIFITMLRLK